MYELCVVTCMIHLGSQSTKAHPRALVILYGLGAGEVLPLGHGGTCTNIEHNIATRLKSEMLKLEYKSL